MNLHHNTTFECRKHVSVTCSLSSREVLRTINNAVWAHVGEMHNQTLFLGTVDEKQLRSGRDRGGQLWIVWWKGIFFNPISTLKAPLETLRDSWLLEECRASMCLSCVSTFTDLSPLRRHSTPGWLVRCAPSLQSVRHVHCLWFKGKKRLGEGTYSIHSSCWRIVSYSPLRDRHSKYMLTQTPHACQIDTDFSKS